MLDTIGFVTKGGILDQGPTGPDRPGRFGQNILMDVQVRFGHISAIRHDHCCLIKAGYSYNWKSVMLWRH